MPVVVEMSDPTPAVPRVTFEGTANCGWLKILNAFEAQLDLPSFA